MASDLFDLPFEEEEPPESPGLKGEARARGRDPSPNPVATRRVLTVTELTVRVRDLLETEFIEVWVEGEWDASVIQR